MDTNMELTMEDVDVKITQAKPELLKILGKPKDVQLEARLQQVDVINDGLKDEMEPLSLTPMERVDKLLDDLRYGPVSRFLNFCRVMHEEGKPNVLTALKVDIDYIYKQLEPYVQVTTSASPTSRPLKRHFYQKKESDEKCEISPHLLPGILDHCDALERNLMRTPLFDFCKDIPLELTELYVDTDVSVKGKDREQNRIETKDFFSKLSGSHVPNTLLLEGEVGNGKSTLVRRYTHNFCKDFLECNRKGPDVPCQGHDWRFVVYTPAATINLSAEHAIRESIRCKEQHKTLLMNAISEDGDGILLIKDGMDELRNNESVESIRKYTKDCQQSAGKPTILLSSRNGLSQVERVLFDRILKIEGFSQDQGLKYVQKYYKVRYDLTDHPVLMHIRAHTKEVEWVLKNPLLALIFSEVTACEALSLEDIKTLSRVKLLKVFEMHIIRRDQECRHADKTPESSKFYNACLQNLLKDERKMSECVVDNKSPHMAFLNRHTHTDIYANTEVYFTFGHEMFVEFFAIQGLIQCLKTNSPDKKAMLLYLCANSKMRNSLLLTCGYISELEPGLLEDAAFIIQACLVLQVENKNCVKNELTEGLLQLRDVVQETFTPDALTQGLTTEQARTAEDIYHRIQRAFSKDAGALREAGWFFNMYTMSYIYCVSAYSHTHTIAFITSCIRVFTHVQQEKICSVTTHQLLPTQLLLPVKEVQDCPEPDSGDSCQYEFQVSNLRWVLMGRTKANICIVCNCPSDVPTALTQNYRETQYKPYDIDIRLISKKWGEPPPEEQTCAEWAPAVCYLLSHSPKRIHVDAHKLANIDGLLTAIQQVVTPTHVSHLTGGIHVYECEDVSEDVLVKYCAWARIVNLEISVRKPRVLLSTDKDIDQVNELHRSIQPIIISDISSHLFPTVYVSPNGQTFQIMESRYSLDELQIMLGV